MIEIIFYHKPKGVLEKAISWWTKSEIVHAEFHFGGGICFGALNNRGVGYYNRDLSAIENPDLWYRVPVDLNLSRLSKFCLEESGCGYDWKGIIFSQVFHWCIHDKNKWFCSELCVAALQDQGQLLGSKACNVCPATLYKQLTGIWK